MCVRGRHTLGRTVRPGVQPREPTAPSWGRTGHETVSPRNNSAISTKEPNLALPEKDDLPSTHPPSKPAGCPLLW